MCRNVAPDHTACGQRLTLLEKLEYLPERQTTRGSNCASGAYRSPAEQGDELLQVRAIDNAVAIQVAVHQTARLIRAYVPARVDERGHKRSHVEAVDDTIAVHVTEHPGRCAPAERHSI